MPNGGSDCCGTCWFNEANDGATKFQIKKQDRPQRCLIRGLDIENPFWTYCANHPHHNPSRIKTPIGPVYEADSYPYSRTVLYESLDTEEIRLALLELLARIQERPTDEYPSPTKFDEEIIKQLMAFREVRAVVQLRRIAGFDPHAAPRGENLFDRNRILTVALAMEALGVIEQDAALDQLQRGIASGLPTDVAENYVAADDKLAPIRYHAVLGLKHCNSASAKALLEQATLDPHPEIRAFAAEILK